MGLLGLAVAEGTEDLKELKTATDAARSLRTRRDSFLATIDAQESAARVSIEAAVEEAIRSTMRRQSIDEAAIETAVNQCLDAWWAEQDAELDRVLRDTEATMAGQRERSAWKMLADIYVPENDTNPGTKRRRTGKLGAVSEKAKDAVRSVDKLREEANKGLKDRAKTAATSAAADTADIAKGATRVGLPKGQVAIAALPVVL